MVFHRHRNSWPWMTLNSHFALDTVFRVESVGVDALVLRRDCFKIDGVAHNVSGKDVTHGLQFLAVKPYADIRRGSPVRWCTCKMRVRSSNKCEFSPSIARPISFVWSSRWVYILEFTQLRAVFPCYRTALVKLIRPISFDLLSCSLFFCLPFVW